MTPMLHVTLQSSFVTFSSADGDRPSALFSEKSLEDWKTYRTFAPEFQIHIDMIDLKNPKWDDFQISDMPKRELKPGVKVHCGIYRRKPGSPRPQYKQHNSISIPKEIFDGHLQTGVYRIG